MQELADRPDMVGDPGRHRRRLTTTIIRGETGMGGTEIIDRADQIHPADHGGHPSGRPTRAAAQRCQTTAEGAIESLDVRRVEYLTARRTPDISLPTSFAL